MRHVLLDPGFTQTDVNARISEGVAEGLSDDEDEEAPFVSPPQYSFHGFHDTGNSRKWLSLLQSWLPTFDPTAFLIRKINAKAPVGKARGLWVQCLKAVTNLVSQFERTNAQGDYVPSIEFDQLQMLLRCMPAMLLQVQHRDTYDTRAKKVSARCGKFLRGQWRCLFDAAVRDLQGENKHAELRHQQGRQSHQDSSSKRHEIALEQARELNYSKAMHILRSPGISRDDVQQVRQALRDLHPPEKVDVRGLQHPGAIQPNAVTLKFINGDWVRAQIRNAKRGTAVDQWGWDSREMWEELVKDDELIEQVALLWFRPVAAGYLPEAYAEHLTGGRLVALSKHPKPGIRPICISDTWRRLTAKGLIKHCSRHIQAYFQEAHPTAIQFGGNTRDGATNMFHLLASINEAVSSSTDDAVEQDPVTFIALDIKNAFNTLSRQHLIDFLATSCADHTDVPTPPGTDPNLPIGWDLLWRHIRGHYGRVGILKHYHGGGVEYINSEAGVQQGDPLGSTLFAMGIHSTLIDIARKHPDVLLTAYADNVIIIAPLSKATEAVDMYREKMSSIGLHLNAAESEAFIPAWAPILADRIKHIRLHVDEQQQQPQVVTAQGTVLPWSRHGIKILGCPLGSLQFCEEVMKKTARKIENDIDLLLNFPHKHHRIKLATFCVNTRANYFLRATSLDVSRPIMKDLDRSFDRFWTETLNFEPHWDTSQHNLQYSNAIRQLRLGIRQGGCGFTSNDLIAPAALYSGLSEFAAWSTSHNDIDQLPWLAPHLAQHLQLKYKYIEENLATALHQMQSEWGIQSADEAPDLPEASEQQAGAPPTNLVLPSIGGLAGDGWPTERRPKQHDITRELKRLSRKQLCLTLPEDSAYRLDHVSRYSVPSTAKESYIAPSKPNCKDTLPQNAMCLFALSSSYELSNAATETSLALQLGFPIPHVRFLREKVQGLRDMDPFGDRALNDPVHASNTRISSHDKIAQELATIASEAGIPTTALQRNIPFTYDESDGPTRPDQPKKRRGDVVTTVGGVLKPCPEQPWINNFTRIILDVKLGHMYESATASHPRKLKRTAISTMETSKRTKYQQAYRDKGLAFAPAVCNTWGEMGPDLLRFLWAVAEFSARHQVGLPDLGPRPPPAQSLADNGVQDQQEKAFKKLRGRLFHAYRQRMLCVILEGVTERVFGRTHCLTANRHYQRWQRTAREPWQPVLSNPPVDSLAPSLVDVSLV